MLKESNHKDNIFYKPVEIRFFDCDCNKNIRISSVMKYIADIAGVDFTSRGFSHEFLWQNNMVFLLSKVMIKQYRTICANEAITVQTFPRSPSSSTFTRDFLIVDSADNIVVSSSTSWVLVNPTNRKILRPTHFTDQYNVKYNDTTPCDAVVYNKIFYNNNDLIDIGTHTVRYSDIDGNNHVYNAVYGDIVYDFLPHELACTPLKEFKITFKKEAVLGDKIDLAMSKSSLNNSSQEDDNDVSVYTVVGTVLGKTCFEAELTI